MAKKRFNVYQRYKKNTISFQGVHLSILILAIDELFSSSGQFAVHLEQWFDEHTNPFLWHFVHGFSFLLSVTIRNL
jgi:hypothetical protein